MYFYLKCICFSWVFNCIWVAADNVTLEDIRPCPANLFGVTSFSHSTLLVSWEPKELKGKNDEVTLLSVPLEGNKSSRTNTCLILHGRCKISWLKENTSYKIVIYHQSNCSILGKTISKKRNSRPTKPDFKFTINNEYKFGISHLPIVEIEWLPCGRKGYCEGEEIAGSHFLIKYKMLHSRQEWRTYEYNMLGKFLYGLVPGRPYEVVVTSISDENVIYETDSDPQEVLIPLVCSFVRLVEIITLSNSSVFISWKPPKDCQRYDEETYFVEYVVLYKVFDNSPVLFLNYSTHESPYEEIFLAPPRYQDYTNSSFIFVRTTISNLTPGTRYTFFIFPRTTRGLGFEYRIDYTLKTYPVDLPLAQPEFHYALNNQECTLLVFWLPCGGTYDCKNTKPGSHSVFKYRRMTVGSKWEQVEMPRHTIEMKLRNKYKVSVESWDEFYNSKSSKEQIIDISECV